MHRKWQLQPFGGSLANVNPPVPRAATSGMIGRSSPKNSTVSYMEVFGFTSHFEAASYSSCKSKSTARCKDKESYLLLLIKSRGRSQRHKTK